MSWGEKVEEWKSSEVTLALKEDIEEALDGLRNKLIYEDKAETVYRLQGLCQAYLDVLNIITNGDLKESKDEPDSN